MTRLNTRLTQHIDLISKNNEALRKKLKLLKERERRDKEAHEAALREAQEMEDARRGHMTSVVHAHDRTQQHSKLLSHGSKGAGGGTFAEKDSDDPDEAESTF